jgi:hypothetical protein
MVGAATQEGEEIPHPVADLEAQDVAVEPYGRLNVGDVECDMPKLIRRDAAPLRSRFDRLVVGEDLDAGTLRIVERQHLRDIGLTVVAAACRDSVRLDLRRVLLQVRPGSKLESKRNAPSCIAASQNHRVVVDASCQISCMAILIHKAQAHDALIVIDLGGQIGGLECGVCNAVYGNHISSSFRLGLRSDEPVLEGAKALDRHADFVT